MSGSRGGTRQPVFAAPSTTTAPGPAVIGTIPSTAASPGRPATTAAPPSESGPGRTSTPAAQESIRPAAPGTYLYDTTGQSSYPGFGGGSSPYPPVTPLVVDPPAGSRQHATRDLRDVSRNGPVIETALDYRPDGVYLDGLKLTTTLFLFSDVQDLRPGLPTLLLPTGAGAGYHRELGLSSQGPSNPARLAIDVVAQEAVAVGDQTLDTTVIRLTATLAGQFNARMELTVWLSPTAGLWVKERSVSEASGPDGQALYRGEYDATLQQLTPR